MCRPKQRHTECAYYFEDTMPSERFKVRVTKDHLVFCCGHFISYAATSASGCTATTTAPPSKSRARCRRTTTSSTSSRSSTAPRKSPTNSTTACCWRRKNPVISVEDQMKCVRVRYEEREWLFPRDDCILLPIENTTAELAGPLHRRAAVGIAPHA